MKIKTSQSRTIKVELAGDTYRQKTFPKIRLQGKWLEELGFAPNGRVEIVPVSSGEICLRFIEEQTSGYQLNETNVPYSTDEQLKLL